MTWITDNYQWIFSGIGVAIVGFILNKVFNNKAKNESNSNDSNNITITNNINSNDNTESRSSINSKDEKSKKTASLLFIDDQHLDYKMVSVLKKAGWINTKSIKDVTDLDDSKVLSADFIFVDINGVGKSLFKDEGLGLASALKVKYPTKKIILYSAETDGDRFHKALRVVDDCLPKNAEPYQFINLIESLS